MGMLVYVWTATVFAALWLYFRRVYTRFSRHGVKNLRAVPPLGNMWRPLVLKEHLADDFVRAYNAFPNERFVGRFEFVTPMVVVRDIELVKKITVKDFESFLDHRSIVNEKSDPFFGRNLFALKGQEWKDMRSTLSPAFTSSKMRQMVPFMMEAGDNMIEALKMKIKNSEEGFLDIDVKDLTTRYANDVIASCAFGLKVDSQSEDNQFYKMGIKTASSFSVLKIFILFAFANCPNLARLFKLEIFPKTIKNFFRYLVSSTMSDREASGIIRPDLIHLLMEAKKGKIVHEEKSLQDTDAGFATVEESAVGKRKVERVWAEDDLISQVVLFFIAGFEGISAVMSFTLHELAVNPEVQDKLLQEIVENDKKNNGKFDYKSIQNMTYLDMVVSEVLRKWPAGIALDRTCNKDYNLGKPNSQSTEDFYIRKGEVIMIPVWAYHHDPAYFPDPSKFDPERFSEENKHKINPLSYVPFGLGPRNCIGSRFALCEIKVMLYQLLQHMEVCPNEKTRIPARLCTKTFNLRMHGGHWLRVKPRK